MVGVWFILLMGSGFRVSMMTGIVINREPFYRCDWGASCSCELFLAGIAFRRIPVDIRDWILA